MTSLELGGVLLAADWLIGFTGVLTIFVLGYRMRPPGWKPDKAWWLWIIPLVLFATWPYWLYTGLREFLHARRCRKTA